MTKKVSAEVVLSDILERLRAIEKNSSKSDQALNERLSKIESEIENVKKAAKAFSMFVKIITGLVAFVVTVWNLVGRILAIKK